MTATMVGAQQLGIGGRLVEATLVSGTHPVEGAAIVVNLSPSPLRMVEDPPSMIAPLTSTVLIDTELVDAELALLLRPAGDASAFVDEPGWALLADLMPGFPREVALWRGPQEDAGTVTFDPGIGTGAPPSPPVDFDVRLNLWFAPAGTDCAIHNGHPFIEVHTQVIGTGRMQKFRTRDHRSIYEDVVLAPGATHAPFGSITPEGLVYPWHQYYADTDCVWLAVEYHRTGGSS